MRKKVIRRKPKKRGLFSSSQIIRLFICLFGILLFLTTLYHYRFALAYYFSFKSDKTIKESEDKRKSDIRNFNVLENNKNKVIGIDVSEYQGEINWVELDTLEENYTIDFVFVRATVGNDRLDKKFKDNWAGAKKKKLIRGAYHYYRPNENSIEQALLFEKSVQFEKGDLPPVLDIEKLPKNQSIVRLKLGLHKWLNHVEAHYKVRPIIYTGEKYYDDFLKNDFSDYLFWIANYNFYREKIEDDWLFWQFTEKASLKGIKGNVDVNIYNGDLQQLGFIMVE